MSLLDRQLFGLQNASFSIAIWQVPALTVIWVASPFGTSASSKLPHAVSCVVYAYVFGQSLAAIKNWWLERGVLSRVAHLRQRVGHVERALGERQAPADFAVVQADRKVRRGGLAAATACDNRPG